jgi:hypothetical protein
MVHFSEAFVGGFFGIGRTYGAAARFDLHSTAEMEGDWLTARQETATWRKQRDDRATALHLYFDVSPEIVWEVVAFIAAKLLVPPTKRPAEFQSLLLEIAVFGLPDREQYLDVVLYPEDDKPSPLSGPKSST